MIKDNLKYARRYRISQVNDSLNYIPVAFLNTKWKYYIPLTRNKNGNYSIGHSRNASNIPFTLFSNTKNFNRLFKINPKTGKRSYISNNTRNTYFNINIEDPENIMSNRNNSHTINKFRKRTNERIKYPSKWNLFVHQP